MIEPEPPVRLRTAEDRLFLMDPGTRIINATEERVWVQLPNLVVIEMPAGTRLDD